MGDDEDVRITFRISEDKKNRWQRLIDLHNALADSDDKLTMSDLLQESVEESITDLEDELQEEVGAIEEFLEGNPKVPPTTAD
ncbi:hypothetical protein EGH21_22410 [Halomicroarcula sp. F13]|uniref:Uncharacterized protein n=1 Tax=Haloarcula rubra TaxID=2487747 RepID=A0AAW4PX87_9EURY|nr:hypothetical protein [Halomicroarcula rubra]MBX0325774.1 hypothetical protein [Halomicroarcula rubra]